MLSRIATTAVLLTLISTPAAAQTPFYQGKQISFLVSVGAGGGYDTQARLVARHLGRHIPGNPTIVVQNMPRAGGLTATNHLYNVAAKDGTVIALVQRSMLLIKNWNPSSVRFELNKFNWIGSINSEVATAIAWHSAPHKSAQDLVDTELVVGGVAGADSDTTPRLFNALLRTKFKITTGYRSTADVVLAMERGEVHGIGDWSWSSLKKARPDWLRENKIRVLMQAALQKEPELHDVPSVLEFIKNDSDREVMELYLTQKTIARPVIAPPDVPSERIAILRAAFMAMAQDKAFMADAEKTGLDVAPTSGEAVVKAVSLIVAASPETAKRLGNAIASPK